VRPLELTLEGFRSYRSATTFELDGRGLFGIVGPTGAGKSSILDALIYALYGRTPQIGKETKKLIASGVGTARVRLLFEVDGAAWEVTRVIRDQGASQVVLHREGDGGVEASGERSVNERISDIVGLDYDSFCSSVTLPQGEFDRFLKATPSDRSKILKRIFRYERVDAMREGAKRRLAGIEVELKAVQAELAALPADPQSLLAGLEAERAERELRIATLREGAADFAAAQGVVAAAAERLARIRNRTEVLEATLAAIPASASLEGLAAEEEAGLRRLSAAEAAQSRARLAAEDLARRAAGTEAELGGDGLATARALASRRQVVVAGAGRRQELVAALARDRDRARGSLDEQKAVAAAAEQGATRAEEALRAARQAHAAHLLRVGLRPGEPCPVCNQEVVEVPAVMAAPVLDAAQEESLRAARDAKAAVGRLTALHREASSAEAKLQAGEDQMGQVAAELAELEAGLEEALGAGVDAVAEIARRDALLGEAGRDAAAARAAADAAAGAVTAAREGLEAAARKRRRVAGELIHTSALLGVEAPGIEDEAGSLAGAAKRASDAGMAAVAEQDRLGAEVVTQEAESRALLARLRSELGLGPAERIEDALQAAAEAVGALGQRIAVARAAIETRAALEIRTVEIQVRRSVYQRLASDLTDAKFTAYLLDAERHFLARLGSEKLFQLTGRYRFDEEGEFHVLDVASGVVRSPDTLSGGETFLASLALALALAEAVSQGGSRLDCFFLDEGFGSLDAASLDLALEGIESLALPGRLIGVISHVGGVQARLDDLIVLEKGDDGSTVVLQTEGPIAYPTGAI
jgi:exonuclease SbcC